MDKNDWYGANLGFQFSQLLKTSLTKDKVICTDSNELGTNVSGYSYSSGGLGGIGHPGTGMDGHDYQGIGLNPF